MGHRIARTPAACNASRQSLVARISDLVTDAVLRDTAEIRQLIAQITVRDGDLRAHAKRVALLARRVKLLSEAEMET